MLTLATFTSPHELPGDLPLSTYYEIEERLALRQCYLFPLDWNFVGIYIDS